MLRIYEMLRKDKVYTGKEIKEAVLKDRDEAFGRGLAREVEEFYINYIRGEIYFPIADTEKYKLELAGNNIEAVSIRERSYSK